MHLKIDDKFHISDYEFSDTEALVKHLNNRKIYENTLRLPYPYTESDALKWIQQTQEHTRDQGGRSVSWAIRQSRDGELIGGIGFINFKIGESHLAEIGYWLAEPFWGQGIATKAVRSAVAYGFNNLGLLRVTANVFHFNGTSARVLEKVGFKNEGYLRSHYKKDGKIFDGKLYALLPQDLDEKSPPEQPEIKNEKAKTSRIVDPSASNVVTSWSQEEPKT